jgi:hypothetical protein
LPVNTEAEVGVCVANRVQADVDFTTQPRTSRRPAMHNLLKRSVRWGLALVCLGTMIGGTTAGMFTRGCAARDLQILMVIEDRENTNAVSAEKLSDAMLSMLEARLACYQGRVVDAMALYDSIVQGITPDTFLSAQRK